MGTMVVRMVQAECSARQLRLHVLLRHLARAVVLYHDSISFVSQVCENMSQCRSMGAQHCSASQVTVQVGYLYPLVPPSRTHL